MRKFLFNIVIFLFVAFCFPVVSFADYGYVYNIIINGKNINLESEPFISEDRILVPAREILEKFGADVTWNDNERCVKIIKNAVTVSLVIDSPEYMKNNKVLISDASPRIRNDRTFIPLRIVSECIGYSVDWYDLGLIWDSDGYPIGNYKVIEISSPDNTVYTIKECMELASNCAKEKYPVPQKYIDSYIEHLKDSYGYVLTESELGLYEPRLIDYYDGVYIIGCHETEVVRLFSVNPLTGEVKMVYDGAQDYERGMIEL